ncbi:MAG: C40 family peptidase [Candidatus Pacebacteria bacterium]|nr:C40 family peptidase [Candidatus Paceibacterota bacterium]
MKLPPEQVEVVIAEAHLYLDRPYDENFGCVDFVRRVYQVVGVEIPRLMKYVPPPHWINIDPKEIDNPPPGHLMFLRRKLTKTTRPWTHVVLILPDQKCIHCSRHFGEKVCISSLEDIFVLYDFAPSRQA